MQALLLRAYSYEDVNQNNIERLEIDDENSDKSLVMYLDLKFSRNGYENLRRHTERLCDKKLYLPCSYIQDAKKMLFRWN